MKIRDEYGFNKWAKRTRAFVWSFLAFLGLGLYLAFSISWKMGATMVCILIYVEMSSGWKSLYDKKRIEFGLTREDV